MSLADRLATPPLVEPSGKQKRAWDFTAEYDPTDINTQNVTLSHSASLETEDDWTQAVIDMGGKVAAGYRVRLVEMRHNTHGWSRAAQGEDATTTGTWFYRFAVEPIVQSATNIDELVKSIGGKKTPTAQASGPGTFHWLAGDLQLGKMDGDGSAGIVDRVVASIDAAVIDFKALRKTRTLGLVHLAWLGDCGEGNQSQKGNNMWRTELTVTEQYRVFRRLMLYAIDSFAPLVETVENDVVNGNHDDVQRMQTTRADDGHATEAAIALADGLELNPAAYGHVRTFVPNKDEHSITRPVGDSVMTMTHGHHWSRGKAFDWWAGQSLNQQSPAASSFLLHAHEHQWYQTGKRDRTVMCVPTFESESTWWRHKTGDVSKPGALVMTTQGGEFRDLRIV